jgi:hypothetical protein
MIIVRRAVLSHSSHTAVDSVPKRRGKDRMIRVAIKEAIARTIDAHMGASSN